MIACELTDYLEIACVFQMELKLETKTGVILFGKALNIVLNDEREECLLLEDNRKRELMIVVTDLKTMTSLFPSRHFSSVEFT